MRFFVPFLVLILFTASACSTASKGGKKREARRVVPVAFNIKAANNSSLNFINLDYYRLKVLDELEDFQNVQFLEVEPDESPEITLNLSIDNFVLWPRDERVSRRTLSRVVQTGTDASGKPVYQTVQASVDIIQIQRRSNARFAAEVKFKEDPTKNFKKTFSPNYNYTNTYVDNIRGDQRAVDPSLYFSRNTGLEPQEIDFLLALSREVIQRLSSEFRSFYSEKKT